MIEEFLKLYSYWPRSLAESFSDLLHLAIPSNSEYVRLYDLYRASVALPKFKKFSSEEYIPPLARINFDLLSPQNKQHIKTYDTYNQNLESNPMQVTIVTRYDMRLFSDVRNEFRMHVNFSSPGIEGIEVFFQATIYGITEKFIPIYSLILLIENGVKLDYSINRLKEFNVYFQAYQKNFSQIAATVDNSEAAARDELTQYSRELQAQIDNEERNLENLAITLQNQTQAESFEVSRDIANLILTAQGVALQISERLP